MSYTHFDFEGGGLFCGLDFEHPRAVFDLILGVFIGFVASAGLPHAEEDA